jgi:class 3 adenylate cyclase
MRSSRAGWILATGTLILGLAWAWFVVRDVAWDRMQDVHGKIRDLTYADFMLNLEVLRVRSGVVSHYDDVSQASHTLNMTTRDLLLHINQLPIGQPELGQVLQTLQQNVRTKIAFVESFQAQNSILRNSESFMPALLDEYGRQHTQELAQAVQGLILRTLVLADHEAGRNLRKKLESLLVSSDSWDWDDIKSKVARHGLKTLEIRQNIQPMMHTFLNIPVHESITQLNQIVMKQQSAREHSRQRSRNILSVAVFAFFLLSLLMLIRFIRLNRRTQNFVPYEMLNLLGKKTLLDIEYGTSIQREMTVMFVDLRDFSRTCETRKPAENFAFVNEYLAAITPAIQNRHGFVSQFSGDGFMALFPESSDDALSAALDIIKALSDLNARRHGRGEDSLYFGIGINTSELMLGAIGHRKRMECSVLGNGVNIAARVEGLTRFYGCEVLLTESSVHRLKNPQVFRLRLIDRVRPKGLQEPIPLFELLDGNSATHQEKARTEAEFQEARQLYQQQKFHDAAVIFSRLSAHDPVSAVFLERCQELQHSSLSPEWNAIADFAVK